MNAIASIDSDIDSILKAYPDAGQDQLIPILQDVQNRLGYLPRKAILKISQHCGMPVGRVHSVATFYNQFRFHAPGRNHVQVCRGTACHVKGSLSTLDAIRGELDIEHEQTTHDGEFSLEVVACVGACGLAPVVCVNGNVHGGAEPQTVRKTLNSYRKKEKSHAAR